MSTSCTSSRASASVKPGIWDGFTAPAFAGVIGEQGVGDTAHAPARTGNQHFTPFRRNSMLDQRVDTQAGGIAGGTDNHGLTAIESLRQGHQPVSVKAGILGQATPVAFSNTPAVEYHAVAGLPLGVLTLLHDTRQVDTRHHGKLAHYRRLTGDRQGILVVDGRVLHSHQDIALGQGILLHSGELHLLLRIVFVD